ncbi:Zinc finger CCCH domain-containing protein [Monoraphidium neglectum]|uniref:Zinc finger CCCH domain-containing protein n=1 Tax=Monoraphidium neglectum TaxID=145388 RepID=A0A0D2N4A2_9CHLO|nr:Zinc finger CCCH domain-containing protein [Monoraphidium neglectum]KIZ07117.1 Zinc finger CCCH domain-containing protein [Monoraphidium neglectum]|eukprot:XP_013906136.1 Zinc finger CCCH domain-containing protein [Monoraphidium neglectum]
MRRYKVADCDKVAPHDWKNCPFAHPNERARRRDPYKSGYFSDLCNFARNGTPCPRGDLCSLSHNTFEMWLHPDRYRTQMCKDGTACDRQICFFAHTPEQLRQVSRSGTRAAARLAQATVDEQLKEQQQGKAALASSGGSASISVPAAPFSASGSLRQRELNQQASQKQQQQQQDDMFVSSSPLSSSSIASSIASAGPADLPPAALAAALASWQLGSGVGAPPGLGGAAVGGPPSSGSGSPTASGPSLPALARSFSTGSVYGGASFGSTASSLVTSNPWLAGPQLQQHAQQQQQQQHSPLANAQQAAAALGGYPLGGAAAAWSHAAPSNDVLQALLLEAEACRHAAAAASAAALQAHAAAVSGADRAALYASQLCSPPGGAQLGGPPGVLPTACTPSLLDGSVVAGGGGAAADPLALGGSLLRGGAGAHAHARGRGNVRGLTYWGRPVSDQASFITAMLQEPLTGAQGAATGCAAGLGGGVGDLLPPFDLLGGQMVLH